MAHVGRIKKLADGKPIWLTEFNAGGGGDHVGLIRKAVPQFESDSQIGGYLWFGSSHSTALYSNGQLTAIGRAFNEVLPR